MSGVEGVQVGSERMELGSEGVKLGVGVEGIWVELGSGRSEGLGSGWVGVGGIGVREVEVGGDLRSKESGSGGW